MSRVLYSNVQNAASKQNTFILDLGDANGAAFVDRHNMRTKGQQENDSRFMSMVNMNKLFRKEQQWLKQRQSNGEFKTYMFMAVHPSINIIAGGGKDINRIAGKACDVRLVRVTFKDKQETD